MKKARKRLLSLVLVCIMILSMLPVTAWAASEPTSGAAYNWVQQKIEAINAAEPEGSKYGVNGPFPIGDSDLYQYTLMRSYVDDGGNSSSDTIILILPGDNAADTVLPDYESASDTQPWQKSNPSRVYISSGVTGVGDYAFADNSNLQEVVFQDASQITYVGAYAFSGDSDAVFTDERNTDGAGLDLSGVTTMGEYAFNGCSRLTSVTLSGGITAEETDEDSGAKVLTGKKIPSHAFSNTRLTSISIPEGIEIIGEGAFSGCVNADSITLPDSLKAIENSAFACGIDGDNDAITALTIPANVETIGDRAFYGFTAMATVVVESEVLKKPGDAAFGNNALSAYSGQQTLEDGMVLEDAGTVFKTPSDAITKLFVSGDNCYLGAVSPLTLIEEESYPATCLRDGRNVYSYSYGGETKTLEETLTQLQPNYIGSKLVPASCTQSSYYVKTCDNYFEYDEETKEWVRTEHTHDVLIKEGEEDYQAPVGHAYEVTAINNNGQITNGGSQVTFVCKSGSHDAARDGSEKTVNLDLVLEVRQGDTLDRLSDISLPALTNGTLSWNSPDTELTYGEEVQYFPVTFKPNDVSYGYLVKNGQLVTASSVGEVQLQVGVQVEKVEIDFSNIAFGNASNLIVPDSTERTKITVRSAPQNVTHLKTLYTGEEEYAYSSEEPPVRGEEWHGTVSVTYTYNSSVYWIDPNTQFVNGTAEAPYSILVDEGTDGSGTVTISHRYEIVPGTWDEVEATAINPTYGSADMETVH